MPKGIYLVMSNPVSPDREDEYNDWYDNTHLPEVTSVDGFAAARRFHAVGGSPAQSYLAIYELDAPDLEKAVADLQQKAIGGEIKMSDAMQMQPLPVVQLYELHEGP